MRPLANASSLHCSHLCTRTPRPTGMSASAVVLLLPVTIREVGMLRSVKCSCATLWLRMLFTHSHCTVSIRYHSLFRLSIPLACRSVRTISTHILSQYMELDPELYTVCATDWQRKSGKGSDAGNAVGNESKTTTGGGRDDAAITPTTYVPSVPLGKTTVRH